MSLWHSGGSVRARLPKTSIELSPQAVSDPGSAEMIGVPEHNAVVVFLDEGDEGQTDEPE